MTHSEIVLPDIHLTNYFVLMWYGNGNKQGMEVATGKVRLGLLNVLNATALISLFSFDAVFSVGSQDQGFFHYPPPKKISLRI